MQKYIFLLFDVIIKFDERIIQNLVDNNMVNLEFLILGK